MRGWNSREAPSFKVWSVRFREAITVMMVALSVMFSFPENTGQQQHQQNKNDKEQHGENEDEENQQETEEKDPTKLRHRAFQELELDEATATWHDAKAAYKRLARKWHPDKNIDDPERAKRRFQVINAAFERVQKKLDPAMAGEVDSCEEDDDDGSRQGEAPASSEKNTGGKRKNGKGRKKFKGRKAPPMTKEEKQAQHRQRQADEKFKEEQRQYQDYLREYEKKIKEENYKYLQARKNASRKFGKTMAGGFASGKTLEQIVDADMDEDDRRLFERFGEEEVPLDDDILVMLKCDGTTLLASAVFTFGERINNTFGHASTTTPLMIACFLGRLDLVNVLVTALGQGWWKAVLQRNYKGDTPLILAEAALEVETQNLKDVDRQIEEMQARKTAGGKTFQDSKDGPKLEKKHEEVTARFSKAKELVERMKLLTCEARKQQQASVRPMHILKHLFVLIWSCIVATPRVHARCEIKSMEPLFRYTLAIRMSSILAQTWSDGRVFHLIWGGHPCIVLHSESYSTKRCFQCFWSRDRALCLLNWTSVRMYFARREQY